MELLFVFFVLGIVALIAAISPGPDFLVVSKNSLMHSRKAGMYTALGIGVAILIHVAYTLVGIGFIISQSIVLFSIIKLLGAMYLIYLGARLLFAKAQESRQTFVSAPSENKTSLQAFREGFLTNVLNPKATVFFVSIFSQFVSPELPILVQSMLGVEVAVIVGLWFIALAFMLTVPSVKEILSKFQSRVLKVMGIALIALGIKVAVSRS